MDPQPAVKPMNPWIGAVVAATVLVAVGVAWRIDWWGEQGSGLPPAFDYELRPAEVDPSVIAYQQAAEIPLTLRQARGVAVGPEDRIYVAGDQAVHVFSAAGAKLSELAVENPPQCLAVGGGTDRSGGRVYVGMPQHVEVYDLAGKKLSAWEPLGQRATITSIALGEHDVFVADAGNRIVLRYDLSGKVLSRIGKRDQARGIRGFVIPSPYFDVAVAPDGLLRVANPGYHRIEAYTFDGDLELHWGAAAMSPGESAKADEAGAGRGSPDPAHPGRPAVKPVARSVDRPQRGAAGLRAIQGFCGCCNPASFAVLPDGRVVTAEKGIPWVKVYSAEGQILGLVAAPSTFTPTPAILEETRTDHKLPVLDVAADSQGRVLVLDPGQRRVRIFVANSE